MTLSGNITALADRVADEFNTVRTEIPTAPDPSEFPREIGSANTIGTSENYARADHIHRLSTEDRALVDSVTGKADAVHTHVISDVTGLQDALDLKQNRLSLISGSTSGTFDLDAAQNQAADLNLTGDLTVNVPTNGINHLGVQMVFYADGAARTVTFQSTFKKLAGIEDSYTIPDGGYMRTSIRMVDPPSAIFPTCWIVEAVGVTQ